MGGTSRSHVRGRPYTLRLSLKSSRSSGQRLHDCFTRSHGSSHLQRLAPLGITNPPRAEQYLQRDVAPSL